MCLSILLLLSLIIHHCFVLPFHLVMHTYLFDKLCEPLLYIILS